MTKPNILQLAKQGDARAITSLLNRSLQPKGITAKAAQRDGVLHVLLEGELPPNQPASVRCIHQGLQKLGFVETPVTIYGRERGSAEVCWQSHLDAPLVGDAPDGEVSATPNGRFEQPGLNASAAFADPAVSPPTVADPGQEDGAEAPGAWDDFDFRSAGSDEATAIADNLDPGPNTGPHPSLDNIADSTTPGTLGSSYGAPAASWNDSLVEDRFALDSPDEPTLIVPPQPDEELDSGLQDEDSDSEILLSLWDDADIDEDDMLESSQDDSGDALDLWQDGGSLDPMAGDPAASGNSPGLIGEPKAKRKGASLLPLLLLALLGMVGGAATASRLGMMRLPWLAKVPVVGPLLTPPMEHLPRRG
ncbi:MAG: hypothetical protein HC824_16330 [Synechococcales cyanobacterium RM1_1_8]|nr:hypothetical protein [Synechococcales cyanobacterium RM1_1_8]